MAITLTTDIGAGVNTYYDKLFLRVLKETARVRQFGQKRNLPKGSGKTIDFFQYNKIQNTITSGVVDSKISTEGTDPSITSITGIKKSATIAEYGGYSQHSRLLKATHIDRELKGIIPLWGSLASEVLDYVTQQILVGSSMPVRADLDSTFSKSSTFTAVASITQMNDIELDTVAGFGDAEHDLVQAVVYITSGVAKGCSGVVTVYDETGGATENLMTIAGLEKKPAAGDSYTIVTPAALSSATASNADSLNTAQIRRGMRLLKQYDAIPGTDGFFMGILSPETEEGLMNDTDWTNVSSYSAQVEGKGGGLFKGEVGMWGGVRWVRTTSPMKIPTQADPAVTAGATTHGPGLNGVNALQTGTNYAVGKGVTCSYIMGKEAFGAINFDGFGSESMPKIITKNPGPGDTSNPLNLRSTVGWYAAYAAKMLQPLNIVQLWSAEPQL